MGPLNDEAFAMASGEQQGTLIQCHAVPCSVGTLHTTTYRKENKHMTTNMYRYVGMRICEDQLPYPVVYVEGEARKRWKIINTNCEVWMVSGDLALTYMYKFIKGLLNCYDFAHKAGGRM